MLGFSWSEVMLVIVVAVLAVGPKQLPEVLHGLGKIVRRMQYMRYAMTKQFDDFMDQADLKELRDQTSRIVPKEFFDEAGADADLMKPLDPLSLYPAKPEAHAAKPVQTSFDLQEKHDDKS